METYKYISMTYILSVKRVMLQHYRETSHITTFVFMILEDNIYIYIKTYKYICVYNIKNECTTGKAPGQIFVLGKGA